MSEFTEELEKAFKAGADYMREEIWNPDGDEIQMPTGIEVARAADHYVNKEAFADVGDK